MTRTVMIHGSDEVMASFGYPGTFYRGKWQNVRVTGVGTDQETPLEVRESLVGLVVPTIFTKEQILRQAGSGFADLPEGSRLAYCTDVIDALKSAEKVGAADQLRKVAPDALDMYVFEGNTYEPVQI